MKVFKMLCFSVALALGAMTPASSTSILLLGGPSGSGGGGGGGCTNKLDFSVACNSQYVAIVH